MDDEIERRLSCCIGQRFVQAAAQVFSLGETQARNVTAQCGIESRRLAEVAAQRVRQNPGKRCEVWIEIAERFDRAQQKARLIGRGTWK